MNDVVEVLVHWQAGRSLKQIVRSTGLARNTVRRYLARAAAAGARRQPPQARAELAAMVARGCPELAGESQSELWLELRACREEIAVGLQESTMATVWQRLHDAGRLRCSVITFRRFVRTEMREVDPAPAVASPGPALCWPCRRPARLWFNAGPLRGAG